MANPPPFSPTHQLANFFTDRRLVQALCRKRILSCLERRRENFLCGLTGQSGRGKEPSYYQLLPSRRHWPKLGSKARRSALDPTQERTALLARHVLGELRKTHDRFQWVTRLRLFLADIRNSVANWSSDEPFEPKTIIAIPKSRPGNGEKYRLLALYDLKQSLIASGFAALLRARIEPMLGDECLAFRAGTPEKPPPTHHDGMRRIREYASKIPQHSALWVAECDIKGFFDNLSHAVAQSSLLPIFGNDSSAHALSEFMTSFFKGYDFVRATTRASHLLKLRHIHKPNFGTIPTPDVGVAQGSAISCTLANLVLAKADKDCLAAGNGQGLYLRYCDDIVIIHPDQGVCQDMLNAYLAALKDLQLPAHSPIQLPEYGAQHWKAKSKSPYHWGTPQNLGESAVPWVAFVGYQLRRDGMIRVRPASLLKEQLKQLQVANDVLSQIDRRRAASSTKPITLPRRLGAILHRARLHLVAFSVGAPKPFSVKPPRSSMCWANGFAELSTRPSLIKPLRRLDQTREVAIQRISGRLQGLLHRGRIGFATPRTRLRTPFSLRFSGRPLSYARRF